MPGYETINITTKESSRFTHKLSYTFIYTFNETHTAQKRCVASYTVTPTMKVMQSTAKAEN